MNEGLLRRLAIATLPLFIWAAHFFGCYLLVAAQCSPALIGPAMPARWPLAGLTVLALAACLTCLWRCRGMARGQAPGLLDWARLGSALLGTLGVGLSSVPIVIVGSCF